MSSEPAPVPVREGLPLSYRPRSDPQYVELLDRPPSGDVSTRDAAAFHEVARSLAAAEACVPLLEQSTGLIPLAARDILKAEMARASGLLQLLSFLKGDFSPVNVAVSSSAVVQRVVQSVESERRLRGIVLTTSSSVGDVKFAGDETLLANALFSLLLTTFTLLEGVQNPRVALKATVGDGDVAMCVVQEQATAPHVWMARPVGEAWADVGDVFSAVAMSACQRIAQAWGGRFAVNAADRSTSVSMHLLAIE